jgi:hypothetical protein
MATRCGWLFAVLPFMLLTGCGGAGDDGVKTYRVAVTTEKVNPHDKGQGPADLGPVETGPPKVRLLGAIIPVGGGNSYFVKFLGPIEKIDASEKDFDSFLNSIHIPGDGGKPISWTVPVGWKEAPARQMRVVTLQKVDGSAPDMYISDPFLGSLLENVNRWRAQDVGIGRVSEAELPNSMKEIKLGSTTAYRVDIRGPGGKGGMGPFMGGGK